MKSAIEAFLAFISRAIAPSTKDGKAWKAWLDLKKQEWRDLIALIESDVRDEFKKRAITVLLVPHYRYLPFEWRNESPFQQNMVSSCGRAINVAKLPNALREFVADLLFHYSAIARESTNQDVRWPLTVYNSIIIDLLKLLPADDPLAGQLFICYELNDPVAFYNMDDASGYNPLYNLLNADIPEKWKKRACDRMHDIIRAEIAGTSKPREEFEEALPCYLRIIQLPLSGKDPKPAYSVSLFADQLYFVLELPAVRNRGLIHTFGVGSILKIIAGEEYKYLRHRLAWHIFLENATHPFKAYDQGTMEVAKAILSEFGSDEMLANRVKGAIADGEKRIAENARAAVAKDEKARNVIDQMK